MVNSCSAALKLCPFYALQPSPRDSRRRLSRFPWSPSAKSLNDLAHYKDKSIIVVGRRSGTMEGVWLSADCEKKLVTDGFAWPDSISLAYVRSEVAPPPELPDHFKLDSKRIEAKIKELKRTTTLRPRSEHYRWMVIFGRLEAKIPPQTGHDPKGNLRGYGFGHINGSPAQLISPQDRHAYTILR